MWFIVSDFHWVQKKTLPKVKRNFLYIVHLVAPLAFIFLCLVFLFIVFDYEEDELKKAIYVYVFSLSPNSLENSNQSYPQKNNNRKFVLAFLHLFAYRLWLG